MLRHRPTLERPPKHHYYNFSSSLDSNRTPKTTLRFFVHHELCHHFLSTPKHQSRHDLVAHAPCIFQLDSLRSTNAENQERPFSQAKHIGLSTSNCKPENILPTILLCMQARQTRGDCLKQIYISTRQYGIKSCSTF